MQEAEKVGKIARHAIVTNTEHRQSARRHLTNASHRQRLLMGRLVPRWGERSDAYHGLPRRTVQDDFLRSARPASL
jgi:hypothetical protein